MLTLASPDLARAPTGSGFAWWYVDLLGAPGEGLVIIGSMGLPFVPAREGCSPSEQPSLAISAYRGGREHFYLLSAERAESATWDGAAGIFAFGDSRFVIESVGSKIRFSGQIDAPIPGGGRVRGSIDLYGARCHLANASPQASLTTSGSASHAWFPMAAACEASARLQLGDDSPFEILGPGYLDANRSDVPLTDLGIADWRWGRVAFPDREFIYYCLDPSEGGPTRCLVVSVEPNGRTTSIEEVESIIEEGRASIYGMRRTRTLYLAPPGLPSVEVRFTSLVDDSPFYQRYLVDARDASGAVGRGTAERILPFRLGVGWQRPLIEMRVRRAGSPGSIWLPLFSGLRRDRVKRLVGSWIHGARHAS